VSVAAVRARVLAAVEPAVAASGADLEELVVSSAGRRRLVRLVVDRDGGLPLDDVADLSRSVSDALDSSDAMGGAPYVLEVTSPGVDRPLTEPRHWRRNTGRLVRAVLRDGGEHTGRVLRADDDAVVLEVGGVECSLPLAGVARGEVQVEFNRSGAAEPDAGQVSVGEPGGEDGPADDDGEQED
jgi:ribosome maturation factor RimP